MNRKIRILLKTKLSFNEKNLQQINLYEIAKFLRENKKILVNPDFDIIQNLWYYYFVKIDGTDILVSDYNISPSIYNSYEEALGNGIVKILESL